MTTCAKPCFNILKVPEKIMKKIQSLDFFFDHAYIIGSKIKRISNYKVRICIFYSTRSFFQTLPILHCQFKQLTLFINTHLADNHMKVTK